MKNLKITTFLLSAVCLIMAAGANAQLTGFGNNASIQTAYSSDSTIRDTVFVFNASESEFLTKRGALEITTPDTLKGWAIYWSVFDTAKLKYIVADTFKTDSIIIKNNLTDGGYQVRMVKGKIDTTFRAWVFINKLRMHLIKNKSGQVPDFKSTCAYVDLGVVPSFSEQYDSALWLYHNDYNYFNPINRKPVLLVNTPKISWSSKPELTIADTTPKIRIYSPPAEDTHFYISYSDAFGNKATDEVYYKTKVAKALFKMEIPDSINVNGRVVSFKTVTADSTKGEAPLKVKFLNQSKHGVKFEWYLTDTVFQSQPDSGLYVSADSLDSVSYEYRHPYKSYKVRLVATSYDGCVDSSAFKEIEVIESKLLEFSSKPPFFPNFFTPGVVPNDYFGLKKDDEIYTSLRRLKLEIFNQWGERMYIFDGSVYPGWKGWDGKTPGKRDALPGVYFYVFEVTGWGPMDIDKLHPPKTENKEMKIMRGKGFLHLLRKN